MITAENMTVSAIAFATTWWSTLKFSFMHKQSILWNCWPDCRVQCVQCHQPRLSFSCNQPSMAIDIIISQSYAKNGFLSSRWNHSNWISVHTMLIFGACSCVVKRLYSVTVKVLTEQYRSNLVWWCIIISHSIIQKYQGQCHNRFY